MTASNQSQSLHNRFDWLAANPLISHLPDELDFVACGKWLRNAPADEWGGPPPAVDRQRTTNEVKLAFAPTSTAIKTAMALQNMIYTGLQHRDPRLPANRKWPYVTGAQLGNELTKLPWFPTYAAGATIRGITGCGKTFSTERILSRFQQVYVHPELPDCAWFELKQLVYLVAPMPADGSRGGLLLEIAKRMDGQLGTDYETQLRSRYKTVEKGLVAVLHWLALHRCGLLIIEEAQERHAGTQIFASDFVTFFLRVLNFGVPLALVGNPLAFKNIDKSSQDVRRFSEGGQFVFDPVSDFRAAAWKTDLVPAVWGFNVFEKADEPVEKLAEWLWNLTGGIPDALARLRRLALSEAIAMRCDRVLVEHIELAYKSPTYTPLIPLIEAFVKKEPSLLRQFEDIPVDYFEAKWKLEKEEAAKRAAQAKKATAPPKCAAAADQAAPSDPSECAQAAACADSGAGDAIASQAEAVPDPNDRRGERFRQQLLASRAAREGTDAAGPA